MDNDLQDLFSRPSTDTDVLVPRLHGCRGAASPYGEGEVELEYFL